LRIIFSARLRDLIYMPVVHLRVNPMADDKRNVPVAGSATPSSEGDVSRFLETVRSMQPAVPRNEGRGRLLFAMDATMSRQPTWDKALQIQAEMFNETARIGGLDVQLVYFRGFGECRASKWVSEPEGLARFMTSVECRGGNTQIARVLTHILKEGRSRRINAAVLVGDAMEERIDDLCTKAGEIGLLGVPVFTFQEGHDLAAERAFREISRLTRGAWSRFDSNSARQLRELLSAVAVYAAGGRQALTDYSRRSGSGALLLEQLK
jgi:hypothetical protein